MAVRITQAGVALTVGIIVVVGLIIGGFFVVKNAGEQARREDAIRIAEQNLEEQSNEGVAPDNSDTNSEEGESTTPGATTEETTSEEAEGEAIPSTGTSPEQSANELPQTGPAEQLTSLAVVALVAFSVASYLASRRQTHGTAATRTL